MSAATNRLTAISVPPATDSTSWRSAFGDTRSCSRNRSRKCRIRRRSRMVGDDVGDVRRGAFGILTQDELREHLFERSAAREPPKRLHSAVGDQTSLMDHEHTVARLL